MVITLDGSLKVSDASSISSSSSSSSFWLSSFLPKAQAPYNDCVAFFYSQTDWWIEKYPLHSIGHHPFGAAALLIKVINKKKLP